MSYASQNGIIPPMQAQTHLNSKGLTTLFQQQGDTPILSLQFWVRTGSIHEAPHLGSGLSHLLEHMVFKGTRSYDATQLAQRVSSLGGQWNAYTSTDRTVYHIDGPAQHWSEFLHILHELVFFPTFPRDEWEREREVIRREMAMYDDNPSDISYRALIETLYHAHPRRLPVIGHPQLFDALSYEQMLEYHQRRYTPENSFIVCSSGGGIVDEAAFIQQLDALQEQLTTHHSPTPSISPEPRQWGARRHRREFAQPTSTLILAWRTPPATHPDTPALALLSSILGSGRSAWLHALFHDDKGLAHDVSCSVIADRESESAFIIEADCERDTRDELRDELLAYLAELAEQSGFEQALQRALTQLKLARLRGLSSVHGRANALGISWHQSRNLKLSEEWEQALTQVSASDLVRVIKTYFIPQKLCEISIDPLGTNPQVDPSTSSTTQATLSTHELSNGLRLVTRPDASLPIIHIALAIGAGCASECAAQAGVNQLLAECLLKGTLTRASRDIAEGLENCGSPINSNAGNNSILIDLQCLSEHFEKTLDILADILLNPSFEEDSINTEKQAIIADILDAEQDPLAYAFRCLRSHCFGETSYGLVPDGSVESVNSLTRHDVLKQYARLFCGRNMVMSVTGDIPHDTHDQVERALLTLPTGSPVTRSSTPPQKAGELHKALDKEQAVLVLALPGLAVDSEQDTAMDLILEWLRDMAGPIFTELREKRALAYYATATSLKGVDVGCLYFYLGTSPQQLGEARQALDDSLRELYEHGMPKDIFERTRGLALAEHQMLIQSQSHICEQLALDSLLGLPSEHSLTLPERLRSTTHAEVNELLRHLLRPEATRSYITVSN